MTFRTTLFSIIVGTCVGIICIPMMLFAQTAGQTQQVWNPNSETFFTVPGSWVLQGGNWNVLKVVLNPVTNSWIYVPTSWITVSPGAEPAPVVVVQTQKITNPNTGQVMIVPASWNTTGGNWNALQPVRNPITGSWIYVPAGWVIPPTQNPTNNDPLGVTPTTGGQVPGASSDPLNPGGNTGPTIVTTTFPPVDSGTLVIPITSNNRTIRDLLNMGTGTLNVLFPILISLATIVFMISIIGVLSNSENEQKRGKAKDIMLWAIFALFVMISMWGIVRVFSNTAGFQFGLPQLSA
jgi:hypothetical protein